MNRKDDTKTRSPMKYAGIALFAAALISCSSPVLAPSSGASERGASLLVSVTPMAPWLAAYQSSSSRAFLYASRLRITVLDNTGAESIAPREFAVSAAAGSTTTLPLIEGIPSGFGNKVIVDIFNSAVSDSVPVVSGSVTGVIFSYGFKTTVSVTCIPTAETAIPTDGTPQTASLAQGAEAWYSVFFNSGYDYTISQASSGMGTFLFDTSAGYIATLPDASSFTYRCIEAGTYRIGVAATDAGSSVLAVTFIPTPKNEGTLASPLAVALDTTRTFRVGRSGSGQSTSYYAFTTGEAGIHYFDSELSASTLLDIYLYADSGYSSQLAALPSSPYGGSLGNLAASTTYYLKVVGGSSSVDNSFPGMIASPGYQAANFGGEGSISSPIALTLGTTHPAGRVSNHSWDSTSYYSFDAGLDFDFNVAFSSLTGTITVAIYSDPEFTTLVSSYTKYGDSSDTVSLSPGTTCFLAVSNGEMHSDSVTTFAIAVSSVPFSPIPLPPPSSLSTYSLGSSPNYLWFEVPVVPGANYAFTLKDSFSDGASYTCDVKADIYLSDRTTAYSGSFIDDASATPYSISVPAGETKLYIKITPYQGGDIGSFGLGLQ